MTSDPHTLTRAQVIALLEERDVLREHVRQLEEELAPAVVWPPEWKLTRREQIVLSTIIAAAPNWATRSRLLMALYGIGDVPQSGWKVAEIHLHHLRRKLGAQGFQSVLINGPEIGWRMPGEARGQVMAAALAYREADLRAAEKHCPRLVRSRAA